MVHAAEGTLQAYLDGEIDSAAAAALSEHVAVCEACAGELDALRRTNSWAGEALALLDMPAPVVRAQAAIARERRQARVRHLSLARLGTWSLAKAAMLMLVLAGAGAAAIPDVRRALETTFARVAELFGAGAPRQAADATEPVPVEPAAPAGESSLTYIAPADGRVRVVLHAPAGEMDVVVRLIDRARAEVETVTVDGPVRRRSANGRLELMGLGRGTVTIGVPQDVPHATVEVDGEVRVYKDGSELRTSGSDAAGRGSEVRFSVGS